MFVLKCGLFFYVKRLYEHTFIFNCLSLSNMPSYIQIEVLLVTIKELLYK
jgi:hypothetical protein